jgi:hypothetical protein
LWLSDQTDFDMTPIHQAFATAILLATQSEYEESNIE